MSDRSPRITTASVREMNGSSRSIFSEKNTLSSSRFIFVTQIGYGKDDFTVEPVWLVARNLYQRARIKTKTLRNLGFRTFLSASKSTAHCVNW